MKRSKKEKIPPLPETDPAPSPEAEDDKPHGWAAFQQRRKEKRMQRRQLRRSGYERVRHHYVRNFYFTFAAFFILFGLVGIGWFLYQQDPDIFGHAEQYYQAGVEQREEGEVQKAEESLLKCLDLTPTHTAARLELLDIYMEQGRYSTAQELLETGISIQPRNEEYYRRMVLLYTAQNRITEAMDYFSGISATYIKVKLQNDRPDAIVASPDPGTYSQPVDVTLTVPAGATVYYTTDGSDPSKDSTLYQEGDTIHVERGAVQIRAFAITEEGMVGDAFSVSFRVYNDYTVYSFADAKVERLVRIALGKTSGTVYYRDLEQVTSLSTASALAASLEGKVRTLQDLTELPNLAELVLDGEDQIESLEPLRSLTQLKTLSLNGCGINNDTCRLLSSLMSLTSLSLKGNGLTDISGLTLLTGLKTLDLSDNQLMSLPSLSGMTLQALNLSGNALNSIAGISGLSNLTTLDLSNNMISDITSIIGCSLLTDLNLRSNLLSNIDVLAALVRLQTLNVADNDISSLAALTNNASLMNLNASGTLVSDLSPLAALSGLTTLDVSRTSVTDFAPLRGKNIRYLSASGCFLVDVSGFVTLTSIETLDLSDNYLADISGLAMLYRLNILNLANNLATDLSPLLNCPNLELVNCTGMAVSEDSVARLAEQGVSVVR